MSPQLAQEVMLDEVNDAALVNMMWETQMYLYEKRDSLQSLAKLLLNNWNHKQIHEALTKKADRDENEVFKKWLLM